MPNSRLHDQMPFPATGRQRGAFSVLSAILILVILGFCGFALDLSRVYNRKAEMQSVADAIALAAAAELDGTDGGITRARAAAADAALRNPVYDYNEFMEWSEEALQFGAAPSGSDWSVASEAGKNPRALFYAKVDTRRLNASYGRVNTFLLQVLPGAATSANVDGQAVAGRSSINVMPLAVCAMTDTPETPVVARELEMVEYGFRRGISYNLMQLNQKASGTGANFLVNPYAAPGTGSSAALRGRLDVIRPFVCTGSLAMPRVTGGDITVEAGFPLDLVFSQLNSRFGIYDAPCTASTAPPDTNVKEFTPTAISWMTDKPLQAAATKEAGGRRITIADLPKADIDPATTADQYGPLWVYAKAARFSSYTSGQAESAAGYTTFATSDWPSLYAPGTPVFKSPYPTPTPARGSIQAPPAGIKGVQDRRLLNVPLLRCPITGSPAPAEVLAVGKFYMTVQASSTDLVAEFAGLAKPETLVGPVELYP